MTENRTNINWFPGHMAKTRRQITEDLKLIDVVIELIDSRIPISSRNPDIGELTKGKKKIIVLNKIDLSDSKQNNLWVKKFNDEGQPAVLVDSNIGKGINEAIDAIQKIMKDELEKYAEKSELNNYAKKMELENNINEFIQSKKNSKFYKEII